MGEMAIKAARQTTRQAVAQWWTELRDSVASEVSVDHVFDIFATANISTLEKIYAKETRDITDLLLDDIVPRAVHEAWCNDTQMLNLSKIASFLNRRAEMIQSESVNFLSSVNALRGFEKIADVNNYLNVIRHGELFVNIQVSEEKRLFGYLIMYLLIKKVKKTMKYKWSDYRRDRMASKAFRV